MSDRLRVETERVDDIPVLIAQIKRMGIPELVDDRFPAHGNWQGLSPGWVLAVWLTHLLSEGDHRLNQVQPWVEQRQGTLSSCLQQVVRPLDLSDDRLALLLDALAADDAWSRFEGTLTRQLLRVYNLAPARVRVDSTTASGYWTVTEEGLFQFGHSKDHRPDLPQLKVMLSSLDPLGLPVVTHVVSGDKSDDPLYPPAIQQVRETVGQQGLLYIGDVKMLAKNSRFFIVAGGDFYLAPLSKTQLANTLLERYLQPVWQGEQQLMAIWRTASDGQTKEIAEGFELDVTMAGQWAEQTVTWTERRLVIRSHLYRERQERALQERVAQAETALAGLNERWRGKKRYQELQPLPKKVEAILKRYQVHGLLEVTYQEIRPEPGSKSWWKRDYQVQVSQNEAALQAVGRYFGWRVYATNAPQEMLSMEQAALAYRDQYLVERGFGRLKGKPLSLSPMYLHDDNRATGLVRLLSLALRLLTLLEYGPRQRLAQEGQQLVGLYAGNPKRATARPTAEAMLKAFKGITLSLISLDGQLHQHITPLSEVQHTILSLLDMPAAIYSDLPAAVANSP